jgi:hypothetical protein
VPVILTIITAVETRRFISPKGMTIITNEKTVYIPRKVLVPAF